jgi:hypothetical protein
MKRLFEVSIGALCGHLSHMQVTPHKAVMSGPITLPTPPFHLSSFASQEGRTTRKLSVSLAHPLVGRRLTPVYDAHAGRPTGLPLSLNIPCHVYIIMMSPTTRPVMNPSTNPIV